MSMAARLQGCSTRAWDLENNNTKKRSKNEYDIKCLSNSCLRDWHEWTLRFSFLSEKICRDFFRSLNPVIHHVIMGCK